MTPFLRVLRGLFLIAVFLFVSCKDDDGVRRRDGGFFTDEIESTDGTIIRYQGKGKGYPTLVLVHGWSCDRTIWRKQFDALAEHYTVISLDLAGHGASGKERKDYTMESFAADVRVVVHREHLNSVILVGHSMGGAVIAEAARKLEGTVIGLLGVDTYHDISQLMPEAFVDSIVGDFRKDYRKASSLFVRGMFRPDADGTIVEHVVHTMSKADPEIAVNAFRHYALYEHIPTIEEVALPVYCINADLWPTYMLPLRQLSPAAAMTLMPGLGHFPMLEAPEKFQENMITAVNYILSHFHRN